ncbi:MAG TPA: hypothetical protein VM121_03015 [Acidimicrobiales bacterium]|nr:hypothetical protein [Acidimicrobiales bacterium]
MADLGPTVLDADVFDDFSAILDRPVQPDPGSVELVARPQDTARAPYAKGDNGEYLYA